MKGQLKLTEKNFVLRKNIEERIAKLSGGVAMIKVGGITPSEVEEKVARFDDAICAVRSAREEGVLAGGGVALMNASRHLVLDKITEKALISTICRILDNANVKYQIQSNWFSKLWSEKTIFLFDFTDEYSGYDVKEFKEVNMIEAGILDSTKAIRNAYVNAVSASNTLLMTDHVVTMSKSF